MLCNLDIDGDGKDEGSVTCDLDSILLLKEENSEIKGNKILIFDLPDSCSRFLNISCSDSVYGALAIPYSVFIGYSVCRQ